MASAQDDQRGLNASEQRGLSESPRLPDPDQELLGLPDLTPEQNLVLERVLSGENVFFTGPAGSGKSLILHHIKNHLEELNLSYTVTAPTGIAAMNIGGSTINTFAGVGLGMDSLYDYIYDDQLKVRSRSWEVTDVLIIDEISMVLTRNPSY